MTGKEFVEEFKARGVDFEYSIQHMSYVAGYEGHILFCYDCWLSTKVMITNLEKTISVPPLRINDVTDFEDILDYIGKAKLAIAEGVKA